MGYGKDGVGRRGVERVVNTIINNQIISIFSDVIGFLISKGYLKIQQIPLRKYPKSKHLDIFESQFASTETSNVFQPSSNPFAIRERMLNTELNFIYDCFFLNKPRDKSNFCNMLGEEIVDAFVSYGFIIEETEGYRSLFRFVPIGNKVYITSAFDRGLQHFTYLSYDSIIFKELILKKLIRLKSSISILDYCCGIGYVGLEIKNQDDNLMGIDVNPYAIWMSKLNSALYNHGNANFICSGEPPQDKFFDIVVCNPPFVFLPPSELNKIDSYGGEEYGLELSLNFLKKLSELLNPDGRGFMITTSPVLAGEDYLLKILKERYPDISGEYYDLCDSLIAPEDYEKEYGIEGRKHIFISFIKNKLSGWNVYTAKDNERFRFGF